MTARRPRWLSTAFVLCRVLGVAGAMAGVGLLVVKHYDEREHGVEIVDDAYQFKLRPPGKGWRTLGRDEASGLVPEARAGAVHSDGIFAVVIVEAAPEADAAGYADFLRANLPLVEPQPTYSREETFAGQAAVREGITGTVAGARMRFDQTVFVRGGFAYRLMIWGLDRKTDEEGRFAQPARDAFSLTDGPITPEAGPPVATDRDGGDFRVRDGVWESLSARLRVAAPRGWRPATDQEWEDMDEEAQVAFRGHLQEAYFVLQAVPARRAEEAAELRERLAEARGWTASPQGEPGGFELLGAPLELHPYQVATTFPLEIYAGATCAPGRCYFLAYWHARGLAGVGASVRAMIAAAAPLREDDARRLREELSRAPDLNAAVRPNASLRSGVYEHLTLGVRWRKPDRGWIVKLPDEEGDELFTVRAPELGVRGSLSRHAIEGADPDDLHEALVLEWGVPARGRPELRKAKGGPLRVSRLEDPLTGVLVATAVDSGSLISFELWGSPEQVAAAEEALAAAMDGLTVGPARAPVEEVGLRYADRRLGFSFSRPDQSWIRTDVAVEVTDGRAGVVAWRSGPRTVGVMVVPIPVALNGRSIVETTTDAAARRMSSKVRFERAWSKRRFGGQEVDVLRLSSPSGKFEQWTFIDQGRLFTLIALAEGRAKAAPGREMVQGFSLLENR